MKEMIDEDKNKLAELNEAVTSAIAERKEWLDIKMQEYATVKCGEELYDLGNAKLLGEVSRHYRYWQDRDEGVRDTSLSIEYEFQMPGQDNCFDNTSRMGYVLIGTKLDLCEKLKREARLLEA